MQERVKQTAGPGTRLHQIVTRVWTGAYNDGFIHAGNLAYMSLISLFPFFIMVAAIVSLIGEPQQQLASLHAVLLTVPRDVAAVVEPVARQVIAARSGWLLWVGGLVGLWTVGSLVETIRDILRRAYGTRATQAFWRYRLLSTGVILASVVLLLASLLAGVLLGAAQEVVDAWFPLVADSYHQLSLSRFIPALGLYLSLFLLFVSLTPSTYRGRNFPKWPGALLTTAWWIGVTALLPVVLRSLFAYDLTYGSLAGVMIALFFFWLVGLGMVIGAELNAALAETPEERDMLGQTDNRARAVVDGETSE